MAGIPPPSYYHPTSAPPSPPASNPPSPSPSPLPSSRHKPRRSGDLPPALAALLTIYNMTVRTYGPSAPEALSIEDFLWHNHFSQPPVFSAVHTAQITHGRDNPETIQALHSLARNLSDKQDFATALALYTICLSRETRMYGNSHPQTLRSMSGLAFAYQNVGKDEDALEMYERALGGWGDVVNVYTVRARINVASIYADNGRFEDAEEVLRRTVQEAGGKLGGGHESTKLAIHNLGFLLRALGRCEEAVGVCECGEWEDEWADCPLLQN
ncbi:TPR-like protein [Choiromyces venosus 120613-1]|uniref:TPR-like protein n=1 Tax=Choiromyces venosus 120613-1 TaxID=1336337 RepID=A0A3N4K8M8_9PEZI|nr:TPR-like protein [Choiromyces venosus 120613-1]